MKGVGHFGAKSLFFFALFIALPNTSLGHGEEPNAPSLPGNHTGENLLLEQNLALGKRAGLPSLLTIESELFDIKFIRLLAVLDGKLLALPFHRDAQSVKKYNVTFPTPAESLSYEIQFGLVNGKTVLTKRFVSDPHCPDSLLDSTLSTAADFPAQSELLGKAAEVEKKTAVIEYLTETLDRLPDGNE